MLVESTSTQSDSKIHLYRRTQDNPEKRQYTEVSDFDPYFYVRQGEASRISHKPEVKDWEETDKIGLDGDPLDKVILYSTWDVRDVRESFDKHYEADVRFRHRYMLDEVDDIPKEPIRVHYMDIEVSDEGGFPTISEGDKQIFSVATYDSMKEKYITFAWSEEISQEDAPIQKQIDEENEKRLLFDSEKAMLSKYLEYVEKTNPDAIAGWNCLPADSKIQMANGTEKEIQNIEEGDQVIGLEEQESTVATVQNKWESEKETLVLNLENGEELEVSPEHRVMVGDGENVDWKEAKDIEKDEYILKPRKYASDVALVPKLHGLLPEEKIKVTEHEQRRLRKQMPYGYRQKFSELWDVAPRNVASTTDYIRVKQMVEEYGLEIQKSELQHKRTHRNLDRELTKTELYQAGLIITDGSMSQRDGIRFYNGEKELHRQFDKQPDLEPDRKGYYKQNVLDQTLAYAFNGLGIPFGDKTEGEVDLKSIYQMPQEYIEKFLSGVIDGDGSLKQNMVRIGNENPDTVYWLDKLFRKIGVTATCDDHEIRITVDEYNYRNLKPIIRNCEHPEKNLEMLEPKKSAQLQNIPKTLLETEKGSEARRIANDKHRRGINLKRHETNNEEWRDWSFHRIESINEGKKQKAYDIETTADSFISEDFLVHNCNSFDMVYLCNRLDTLDEKLNSDDRIKYKLRKERLAPQEMRNRDVKTIKVDDYVNIKGRWIFDLLKAYRTFRYGEQDSYKLDDIAKNEIDAQKIPMKKGFKELWQEDLEQFLDYNKRDTELTVRLDNQLGLIEFWDEVRRITNNGLEDVLISMRQVDNYILEYAHQEHEVILPSRGQGTDDNEDDEATGGEVFEPKKAGVMKNVAVADLSSLYPSLIMSFNISPETLDPNGDIKVMEVGGREIRYTTEQRGLLPQIFDDLFDKRYEYKDLRAEAEDGSKEEQVYDDRQRGVKVTMNCWTPDTELVTPQGILTVDELEEGDEVYSINPDTREVERKEIEECYEKEYHGDMVNFQSNHMDFSVTPNHRMLVDETGNSTNPEFIQAGELAKSPSTVQIPRGKEIEGEKPDFFYLHKWMKDGEILVNNLSTPSHADGNWANDGRNFRKFIEEKTETKVIRRQGNGTYILPTDTSTELLEEIESDWGNVSLRAENKQTKPVPWKYDIENWLKLLGWYVAEGCVVKIGDRDSYMLNITQAESEPIKELISNMGMDYSTSKKDIQVRARPVTDWITEYVGGNSDEKQLPDWLFNLDAELLEKFFSTAMAGDGSSDGRNHYYTTSENLKEDFVKLAVHLGKKPKVYTQEPPETPDLPNGKPAKGYRDRYKELYTIQFTENKGCITERNISVTPNKNDRVVCVGVKDHQTVLAGRNEKFQWTGNTVFGVLLNPYFRLYNADLGRSITKMGRETVKWSGEIAEEHGYEVVYGDTDSIFVQSDEKDIKNINDTIELIDESYDEFVQEKGVDLNKWDHRLILEFEKFYDRLFFSDAKKRYAGLKRYTDDLNSFHIELENGETALVDPEYEFTLKDGTTKKAKNLEEGDDLDI